MLTLGRYSGCDGAKGKHLMTLWSLGSEVLGASLVWRPAFCEGYPSPFPCRRTFSDPVRNQERWVKRGKIPCLTPERAMCVKAEVICGWPGWWTDDMCDICTLWMYAF